METIRTPYVGEGADGARRSAEIDRSELDWLPADDHRRHHLIASAAAWDALADAHEAQATWRAAENAAIESPAAHVRETARAAHLVAEHAWQVARRAEQARHAHLTT